MASASKRPRWLGRVLKPAFAVLLLLAVGYSVPWRDKLVYTGDGEPVAVKGAIAGDWQAERIAFDVRPSQELEAGDVPAELAAAARDGGRLEVARTAPDGGRYEWRPGLPRVFRELELDGLVPALAFLLAGFAFAVTRWWRLITLAGCRTTWFDAFRLSFLGLFFNLVVPGLTGGDVVKAMLVVRENPARRTDAFVSVVVDRALGLFTIVGIATVVILTAGARFQELRRPVLVTIAVVGASLFALLHPAPRKLLRLRALVARLPQAERIFKLDQAVRLYGRHPFELTFAIALSLLNHLCVTLGVVEIGHAAGAAALDFAEYLGVVSVANLVSSLPIAPNGWGVGEAAYGSLFALLGQPATLGIAISVIFRLLMMGLGLLGGLFLFLPGARDVREDIHAVEAELEAGAAADLARERAEPGDPGDAGERSAAAAAAESPRAPLP
jgi:uncharacterized protein (TIRG00374 family)